MTQIENTDLLNFLFLQDAAQSTKPREQCGLFPGETLPVCSACSEETTEIAMQILRPIIGEKKHLNWHAKWHMIRGLRDIKPDTFQKLQKAGFVPATWDLAEMQKHLHGGAKNGEDFLFMHRMMLKMVQMELAFAGKPCFSPWTEIPDLDDSLWPVPKTFADPGARVEAERSLQTFRQQLADFQSLEKMRLIPTLNELGQKLEPLLHQNLHAFYRSSEKCSPQGLAQGFCDDLLPTETSPLNKHFWKIHGLVDGLVGVWLEAHGHQEIALRCEGRAGCYEWQGTWIGKYPGPKKAD